MLCCVGRGWHVDLVRADCVFTPCAPLQSAGDLKMRISKYDVDDLLKIVSVLLPAARAVLQSLASLPVSESFPLPDPAALDSDGLKSVSPSSNAGALRLVDADKRAGLPLIANLVKKCAGCRYLFPSRPFLSCFSMHY